LIEAEQTQAPARERLLDALGELLADRTFTSVRMADVAEKAGVSRQTIYNAFGTREGLALAYVTREAAAFVETVRGVVAENSHDPGIALRAALEIFLAAAETHPLVRAISASEEGDELLVLVTTGGGPVIGPVTEALTQTIAETWPAVDPETAGLAAETLVRLAISHAALPTRTPAETAERVGRVLGPFIAAELDPTA
jgi:AcrR family transcriptional regulator